MLRAFTFRSLVLSALLLGLGLPVLAQGSTVTAWGDDNYGQVTVPSGLSDVAQLAAGTFHNLALKSDSTVIAWGYNGHGEIEVPTGLAGVVQVAAGTYHSLALKSDNTIVAWGSNDFGQMNVPAGLTDVIQIAAGGYHSLALKSDGTVVAWGDHRYGQTDVPDGLTDVVQVAAGVFHSLALKSDSTVAAWGWNGIGQTAIPTGLTGVVQVAAGQDYSLALKDDGTVVRWSYSPTTSVPDGLADVIQIAAGSEHCLALKSDGTVVAWGRNSYGETDVPSGLSGVVQVAAGNEYSLALALDLFTTGGPVDGSGNPVPEPVAVPAGGAPVPFEASLDNTTADPLTTEVWLAVRFPDGTVVTKRRAKTVTINAGTTRFFTGGFTLRDTFPAGTYTLYGYHGTHPDGGTLAMEITIEKAAEDPLKASTTPPITTAEILALDPDALLTLDAVHATASTPYGAGLPASTVLGRAYPNPFNPTATVPFELAKASDVTLAIYDVLGRELAVLARGRMDAGSHTATFEARDLPSGTYLVRLSTPDGLAQTQRLTLLK